MKLTKEQVRQVKAEAARLVAFYKGQQRFDDMCDYDDTIRGFEAGTGRI